MFLFTSSILIDLKVKNTLPGYYGTASIPVAGIPASVIEICAGHDQGVGAGTIL